MSFDLKLSCFAAETLILNEGWLSSSLSLFGAFRNEQPKIAEGNNKFATKL